MTKRLVFGSVFVALAGCHAASATPVDDAGTMPGPDAGAYVEPADPTGSWRSALFPRGWLPRDLGGAPDASGRLLPDFSYAGYHRGEQWPPVDVGAPTVTVDASFGDGVTDATSALQSSIDAACLAGGGVVHIPAGLYVVRFPIGATAALDLHCSHLVLRGDGPTATRLLLDDPQNARDKALLRIGNGSVSQGGSTWKAGNAAVFAQDGTTEGRSIGVAAGATLAPGMLVAVRAPNTAAFQVDHRMDDATSGLVGLWQSGGFRGLVYPRVVDTVSGGTVRFDAPLRYDLRVRDAADVVVLTGFVEEVGVEHLGLGMVENLTSPPNPASETASDNDYTVVGTTGYEVHSSSAIRLIGVHDGWVADVASFEPAQNTVTHAHVLSHGVLIDPTAFRITVRDTRFGHPEYRGGGGNGYAFHVQGHDNLMMDLTSTTARHAFTHNQAVSGNVWLRGVLTDSRYSSDSHRYLSQSNLYDGVTLDGAWLQAVNRGADSTDAGFTATTTVFWNTYVQKLHPSAHACSVETAQWGFGYVIGTSSAPAVTSTVCTSAVTNASYAATDQGAPVDWVEGDGLGATLSPSSLWERQRALRCAREHIACDP